MCRVTVLQLGDQAWDASTREFYHRMTEVDECLQDNRVVEPTIHQSFYEHDS